MVVPEVQEIAGSRLGVNFLLLWNMVISRLGKWQWWQRRAAVAGYFVGGKYAVLGNYCRAVEPIEGLQHRLRQQTRTVRIAFVYDSLKVSVQKELIDVWSSRLSGVNRP